MRRGQSLVVWAIREGRQCAHAVDKFLMGSTTLPRWMNLSGDYRSSRTDGLDPNRPSLRDAPAAPCRGGAAHCRPHALAARLRPAALARQGGAGLAAVGGGTTFGLVSVIQSGLRDRLWLCAAVSGLATAGAATDADAAVGGALATGGAGGASAAARPDKIVGAPGGRATGITLTSTPTAVTSARG